MREIILLEGNGQLRITGKRRNRKMQLITRESPLTPRMVSQDNGLLGEWQNHPQLVHLKIGNRALEMGLWGIVLHDAGKEVIE